MRMVFSGDSDGRGDLGLFGEEEEGTLVGVEDEDRTFFGEEEPDDMGRIGSRVFGFLRE